MGLSWNKKYGDGGTLRRQEDSSTLPLPRTSEVGKDLL